MTTYYVGTGGNDGNNGTSWAQRKLTINGAEDIPVAAGDTVYVGPGTYREMLTVDVSGSGGSPITYIGDYLGTSTDGVGGIVRITGSDNDQTITRASCITNSAPRSYRTFYGFVMDMATIPYTTGNGCANNIIDHCYFTANENSSSQFLISLNGSATLTNNTVQNCVLIPARGSSAALLFQYSSQVNDSGNLVQNNIFLGGTACVTVNKIGGTTIKNNSFLFESGSGTGSGGVNSPAALTGGQTITVNNNIFYGCGQGLIGQAGNADITEDYNTFYANSVDRTNVNTGAHSVAYPPLFDSRPWFNLMYSPAAAQITSPFDLASYSQLVNLAGTSPTTTDLRGASVQGAQREYGALEYNSNYKISGKHTFTNYTFGIGR